MDAVVMLITGLIGWAFAVFVIINGRNEERSVREAHAIELARRDEKINQLLDQVQLNSQNLPYYPQVGPFPPVEEKRYLASDDGLIVFEDFADAAIAEVAGE